MTLVADSTRLRVRPNGKTLGAEVSGGDLMALSLVEQAAIRQALADHLVLRFRGYRLDDIQFTRFGDSLGELQPSPDYTRSRKVYSAEAPMMTIISNVTEDGEPIGEHGDGELNWHTDLAFTDFPSEYTMLLAREIPGAGGNTWFANMYAAYEAMP